MYENIKNIYRKYIRINCYKYIKSLKCYINI